MSPQAGARSTKKGVDFSSHATIIHHIDGKHCQPTPGGSGLSEEINMRTITKTIPAGTKVYGTLEKCCRYQQVLPGYAQPVFDRETDKATGFAALPEKQEGWLIHWIAGPKLTTRSRVHVRWTTEPAAVGYANSREQAERVIAKHLADKPNFSGTPRQVCEYLRDLARNLGGAYYRVDLSTVKGEKVSHEEVACVAYDAETR